MSADRDLTRVVRSWLRTDEHESADRVLDDVLALLDATPQRRFSWPARRFVPMNNYAKLAIAAAAVVVVAVVGYNLLPRSGGNGGPQVSPSPLRTLAPSPSPTTEAAVFPPSGPLAVGRHTLTEDGVPFSLEVAMPGWSSSGLNCSDCSPGGGMIQKGKPENNEGVWMLVWSVAGVYTDPCGHVAGPARTSAADLATAVAAIPGLEVTGPSAVLVGGHPAERVVVTVPRTIGCSPTSFYLWYDDVSCGDSSPCYRWASALNSTVRIWTIDVDGKVLWLEAETYEGAGPDLDQEIQQIVDSIQFE